jgi:beta-barrel assembly-enhancing protease
MVTFFERLLELQQREPGSVERFFASHPATEERIERVETLISRMGTLGHLSTDDDQFRQVRTRVR